jgi:PadR family transcriptional regulator, regulatory protein PadR
MAKRSTDLLKGTLDLLILKTLELEPRHGVAIADRIAQITSGAFRIKPGSLFPALHRLDSWGYIAGEWGETSEGRRAKVYTLTSGGRKQLGVEKRNWSKISVAMGQVLESE